MDSRIIRRVLLVATLLLAVASAGCYVGPGRGHGWGHRGPGFHPGHGPRR